MIKWTMLHPVFPVVRKLPKSIMLLNQNATFGPVPIKMTDINILLQYNLTVG